ncbi:MAG: TatD family hydrolase [Deltaproteobacteria bacterium]|nr:TatD family hydrolase [Deltaproteobacteria bacterium]
MRLIDSHAHLDLGKYAPGAVDAMLERAWSSDLVGVVAVAGAGRAGEFDETLEIATRDSRIWATAGIHPHTSSGATPDALDKLRFALDHHQVMAVGEAGLDYHYNHSPPADQRRAFIEQIRIAHQVRLPLVIHTREADRDTLAILRDEGAEEVGGVIHCFSSTREFAEQVLDIGFYLSFSGIVTFPKAGEVQLVAAEAPADRILAETDTPFLSPLPHRGKQNEPARVLHVVEKLAEIREVDVEEMAAVTVENTCRFFNTDAEHR